MSARKPTQTPSDRKAARKRSICARFIAMFFSTPGAPRGCYLDRTVHLELVDACQALGISTALADHMFESISEFDDEAFERIMGHTVRSACPPYEMEYRSSEIFQQSQSLADIAGFYRAFGLEMKSEKCERADHVSSELEFLAFLATMESRAKTRENHECCIKAQKDFLAEHVAMWMPAFLERVRRREPKSFWAQAAIFADAFLREWCGKLRVTIGPRWLELRPVNDEDSTITCGAGGTVELGANLAAAMDARS